MAYELNGISRTMLGLAREHALTRVQFGQPISGFQAVRHRLADAVVAIETADNAALPSPDLQMPVSPLPAGIGFTTERAFHRYFRRAQTLDPVR